MGGQSDVVGCDFSEFLNFSYSFDGVYLRHDDFLFFVGDQGGLGLLDGKGLVVLVVVDFVEFLFIADEFEGLGPVELIAVAH